MFENIDAIKNAIRNQKTYQVGLIQAKAYRFLKQRTAKLLEPYKISSIHWAMLGILYDNQKGLRLSTIALELGVEPPFVTRMYKELMVMQLIEESQDPDDSRARLLCLSKKGRKFVEETEKYMRKEMRHLFHGVSVNKIVSYIHVLKKIIDNYKD